MASVHFLNVKPGDCTIIRHSSGRTSMIDICDGNTEPPSPLLKALMEAAEAQRPRGNYRMCENPTNPIDYAKSLGIADIWRFILTHPDMDHMDGFARLKDKIGISNFWDSGARKSAKPDFEGTPYKEEDWDKYVAVRDGNTSTLSASREAGDKFKFANEDDQGGGGDDLHILGPSKDLLVDLDEDDDLNDASYVLLYQSSGGKVLLPGDAHDAAWEHVLTAHRDDVANCSVLLAPHHGRDSDRSYDFLDVVKPRLTIIGCAPSEHIEYDQWHRRELDFVTSNQAGNIVLDIGDKYIDVYIQNEAFAIARGGDNHRVKNQQGYSALYRIPKS